MLQDHMGMFIQKLHPWHTHLPLSGNPSGRSHSNSRAAMLLALQRPLLHQLYGVQLRLVHLRPGKSPARTLDVDGPLYDFKPWAGIHKPPHQSEVALRQGIARPHPDYKTLHGLFGRLVELDQLLQLVAQGHWVFGPSILIPKQLLRRAPLLSPVKLHGIQHTAG